MRTGTSAKACAAVLLAAATLAGCGGSDEDTEKAEAVPAGTTVPQAPSQTATTEEDKKEAKAKEAALAKEVSANASPERVWAKKLCVAMADAGKPLSPPNLEAPNVDTTQRSLVRFFTDAQKQLRVQVTTLEKVGAPPNNRASTEWTQAVGGMETIAQQLGVVKKSVQAAKLDSQKDLEKFTEDLGGQMEVLSNYPGPIAVLLPNPEIGPALKAEPSCSKFT